jgi:RHS repeat-associated protein
LIGQTITTGATTTQTRFVFDGNQIVVQFDGTGGSDLAAANLSHRYLWGPAVDQLMADEQVTNADTVVWALTDNLNTVRDLAVYSGGTTAVVNHRVFSAYGGLLSQTNPSTGSVASVDCLFAYTGRPMSRFSENATTGGTSGLLKSATRWYDAITGRWLRPDFAGFVAGDANLYRYVGNSPTSAIDPNGLDIMMPSIEIYPGYNYPSNDNNNYTLTPYQPPSLEIGNNRSPKQSALDIAGKNPSEQQTPTPGGAAETVPSLQPSHGGIPGLLQQTQPEMPPSSIPVLPRPEECDELVPARPTKNNK